MGQVLHCVWGLEVVTISKCDVHAKKMFEHIANQRLHRTGDRFSDSFMRVGGCGFIVKAVLPHFSQNLCNFWQ